MKQLSVESYQEDKYYRRVVEAMNSVLSASNFVTAIEVFEHMGLLSNVDVVGWRKGQVPFLEKVISCNLSKAGRILQLMRFHAHDLNMKPSLTVYKRKAKSGQLALRFSRSGLKKVEEDYSRHYVKIGKNLD